MNRTTIRTKGLAAIKAAASLAACAVLAIVIIHATGAHADDYVSASPAITFAYNGIRDEEMLMDFCVQLRTIRGITGVSFRDYSAETGRALLKVYYNPRLASPTQIRIFLQHSSIIWFTPRAT